MYSTIFSVISSLLETSIEKLKKELRPIEHLLEQNKEGMYITHNREDTIFVFADLKYKAFIPKKYDGWQVKFVEWDGQNNLDFSKHLGINHDA